jgi:hypothetical protein
VGDDPHDGADGVALAEDVDAEPSDAGDGVGGVELQVVLEALPLLLGEDGVEQLPDGGTVEDGVLRQRRQLAPEADHRVAAGGQVEVGATEVDDPAQDVVDVERRWAGRAPVGRRERLGGQGDPQRCGVRLVHGTSSSWFSGGPGAP